MRGQEVNLQSVLDVVVALAGALGAWILKVVWTEIKDAREDHEKLVRGLPETYARRDDVREAMQRVEALFSRIDAKLDQKADKH